MARRETEEPKEVFIGDPPKNFPTGPPPANGEGPMTGGRPEYLYVIDKIAIQAIVIAKYKKTGNGIKKVNELVRQEVVLFADEEDDEHPWETSLAKALEATLVEAVRKEQEG